MCANWNSYSKSASARRPRTITVGAAAAAEIDEQAVELLELEPIAGVGHRVADEPDALVGGEQRLLALVGRDRDDHVVEQAQRALEDVEVAVRDRIERPGIDGDRSRTASWRAA